MCPLFDKFEYQDFLVDIVQLCFIMVVLLVNKANPQKGHVLIGCIIQTGLQIFGVSLKPLHDITSASVNSI